MKPFYVYMLKCSDGSYYIGHTDDIDNRLNAHKTGELKCYTSKRLPFELVFLEETDSRANAIEFEHKIKKWSRAKKEALIKRDWEKLHMLAYNRRYH